MAGIYIHIPFCKKRCIYCDFYSGTNLTLKKRYVDALCLEIQTRKHELGDEVITTLYLGGGTPSQLSESELSELMNALQNAFDLSHLQETTIECNPDDLDKDYLKMLSKLGFNRISIGIQSLNDDELKFLNRRHTAVQAMTVVRFCQSVGFENISIDLMYGLPNQTPESWQNTLNHALMLNVTHISAYNLMYEEGTALTRAVGKGKVQPLDEDKNIQYFQMMIDALDRAGYEQYEISNFCKPGFRSKHNSSYWNAIPYLGLGAAAHSYDGKKIRRWNISNTLRYCEALENGSDTFYEFEHLTPHQLYDEMIMTRLRTREGIDLEKMRTVFGQTFYDYCMNEATSYLAEQKLMIENKHLSLTRSGIFVSNMIMSDLMWPDNIDA